MNPRILIKQVRNGEALNDDQLRLIEDYRARERQRQRVIRAKFRNKKKRKVDSLSLPPLSSLKPGFSLPALVLQHPHYGYFRYPVSPLPYNLHYSPPPRPALYPPPFGVV
ncbi:hypothetical protein V1512DRAFT_244841 [Lipomyces arxii]|uniref:uncharacterized protein n=1 Tax=Lipomyces arxii TaxID=56418 RepID=UPI0034CDDE4E